MNLLIELPTWLGDSIMCTTAIENLVKHYDDLKITIIGSSSAIEVIQNHPKVIKTKVLKKNYLHDFFTLQSLGDFDVSISFRSSFRARIMSFFITADRKFHFDKHNYLNVHQVEKYNEFINNSLNIKTRPGKLLIHSNNKSKDKSKRTLGINAGASYGSAKRWQPNKFAIVAEELSKKYDIIIFGGENEKDIANEIEQRLIQLNIKNYQNLATKTTIPQLVRIISELDLFITGDSGPMHIAAAFNIPTIAIFGPTKSSETSQWKNIKSVIVKKTLECQPCMKRSCPLKHHDCMKKIDSSEVLDAVKTIT